MKKLKTILLVEDDSTDVELTVNSPFFTKSNTSRGLKISKGV